MLLALQPCIAALESPAHDMHDGDCPHCPSAGTDCMDATAFDCGADDDTLTTKAEDFQPHPPAILELPLPVMPVDGAPVSRLTRLQPAPTGPPLTVRFCCFLE